MKLILKLAAPAAIAFGFSCGGNEQSFGETDLAAGASAPTIADLIAGYCKNTTNVIVGTDGDDDLSGLKTGGADCVLGLGGNDILKGGPGNDVLVGGDGDDDCNSEGGNDTIFGGNGNDTINGGDGNDLVRGQMGDDFVTGDVGNDYVDGNQGDDILLGEGGDDTVWGDASDTTPTNGGAGNDKCRAGGAGALGQCETLIP